MAAELREVLHLERAKFAAKPFEVLASLPDPTVYDILHDDKEYNVEVQLLEKKEEYLHVCISVSDGSFIRSCVPLTASFITHRDGRVEK